LHGARAPDGPGHAGRRRRTGLPHLPRTHDAHRHRRSRPRALLMSVSVQPEVSGDVIVYRRRRNIELALLLFAQLFGYGGWIITHLNLHNALPGNWPVVAAAWFGIGLVAHLAVRWKLPYA